MEDNRTIGGLLSGAIIFATVIMPSSLFALERNLWGFYVGQHVEEAREVLGPSHREVLKERSDTAVVEAVAEHGPSARDAEAKLATLRAALPEGVFGRTLSCGETRHSKRISSPPCAGELAKDDIKGVLVRVDGEGNVVSVAIRKGYGRFVRPKTMLEDMTSQLGTPTRSKDGQTHEATPGFGLPGFSLHDSPSFFYEIGNSGDGPGDFMQQARVQMYKDVITGSWANYYWAKKEQPGFSKTPSFVAAVEQVYDLSSLPGNADHALAKAGNSEATGEAERGSDPRSADGYQENGLVIDGLALGSTMQSVRELYGPLSYGSDTANVLTIYTIWDTLGFNVEQMTREVRARLSETKVAYYLACGELTQTVVMHTIDRQWPNRQSFLPCSTAARDRGINWFVAWFGPDKQLISLWMEKSFEGTYTPSSVWTRLEQIYGPARRDGGTGALRHVGDWAGSKELGEHGTTRGRYDTSNARKYRSRPGECLPRVTGKEMCVTVKTNPQGAWVYYTLVDHDSIWLSERNDVIEIVRKAVEPLVPDVNDAMDLPL